ncbi:MAG: exodeoxyribonuclease VII small subunit [Gemmatimonadota bacterium]|nr:exodeoxyribonuclease VII small subunit [Gemmatimonadota bacterium]MDH3427225.1 exodeoxyribonuclease VII small subunit [Gemmatimonadota bacterium]
MSERTPPTATFEQLLTDLESVVDRLGAEDLELDEALSLFERGVACLRDAGRLLDAAEGRVEELIESAGGDLEAIGFEAPVREEADGTGTP